MKRLVKTDDNRLSRLRKLTEVTRALIDASSLEEVVDLAVRRGAEMLQSPRAVLMLRNAAGQLSVVASFGVEAAAAERFQEPLDETLIHRLQALLGVSPERYLGVPLVLGGEVFGILAVALDLPLSADADEQEWLLSALADQAARALEKTRLNVTAEFRERLIGIVSHDLKNPISAVLLGASILKRAALDEASMRTVRRIEVAAQHAGRMIRDLLDYSQARVGGGIELRHQRADLHAIVRQAVNELGVADPSRVEVSSRSEGAGQWDVDRLSQVVTNLITNALAYGAEGSAVRVESSGEGGRVVLRVHNDGPPIPAERLPHIFEPMQRATDSHRREARNVGLGLYIVEHIVTAHGGTVSVESSDGQGTTFTVRVPCEPLTDQPAAVN